MVERSDRMWSTGEGNGKSTQARLWKEHLDIVQVNDDKNIIIKENDELWIYGNPWSGKSFIDTNIRVKLTDLVFIYQSPENKIREISKKEQFLYLIPQITNSSFNCAMMFSIPL